MSIHPSLSSKEKDKRSRSVLKRSERLKEMLEKEKWKPGDSVFGLSKLKVMRWKMKKAKKAAEAEAATVPGTPEAAVSTTVKAPEKSAKKEEKAAKK